MLSTLIWSGLGLISVVSAEPAPITLSTRARPNANRQHHRRLTVSSAKQHSGAGRGLVRSIPLDSNVYYITAQVGLGVQPTVSRDLLVDTGSAPFVLNNINPYRGSATTVPTNYTAKFSYGDGSYGFNAKAIRDTVRIGEVVVKDYHYALNVTDTFGGFALQTDGILGLAPDTGNANVITRPDGTKIASSRTLLSAAYHQGRIPKNTVSFYNPPTLEPGVAPLGTMTFGGVDRSLYCVWSVDTQFRYKGKTLPIRRQNGTARTTSPMSLDTGASLIYMPTSVLEAYAQASGALYDATADFYYIPKAKLSQLRDLELVLNGGKTILTLSPAAQLYPTKLSASYIDPELGQVSLFYDSAAIYGPAYQDFGILGYALTNRFYVSLSGGKVAFAETKWTYAQTSPSPVQQSPKAGHAKCKIANGKGRRALALH